MKKAILFISAVLALTSCDWFLLDNYEQPNAQVSGAFIDTKTGESVQQECHFTTGFGSRVSTITDGYMAVTCLGWDYEKAENWLIKYDGTYNQTKTFDGQYRFDAKEDNFYPVTKDNVTIKKGANVLDFDVTPYCRIINPTFAIEGNFIVAKFAVELGDASKDAVVTNAQLCCYPDRYVGIYLNNCGSDPLSKTTEVVADGKTINTLKIDMTNDLNYAQFKYTNRTHYCRLAVLAKSKTVNPSNHYNYSETVSLVH